VEGQTTQELDPVDNYIRLYNAVKHQKDILAALEKERKEAEAQVIQHVRGQGYITVKRMTKQIVLSDRTYPKVENFDWLEEWVDKQEEPRGEYMEEVFRKDVLGDIVREVRKKFPGQEAQKLPPGLGFYTKTVVSVREIKGTKPPPVDDGSAKARLARIAEGI